MDRNGGLVGVFVFLGIIETRNSLLPVLANHSEPWHLQTFFYFLCKDRGGFRRPRNDAKKRAVNRADSFYAGLDPLKVAGAFPASDGCIVLMEFRLKKVDVVVENPVPEGLPKHLALL